MKSKLITFILALIIISMTGCSSDDADNTSNDPLHGEWNIYIIDGPISHEVEDEVIILNFNTETLILTITNNDESLLGSPTSGTYAYSIVEVDSMQFIVFENEEIGRIVNNIFLGFAMAWFENDTGFIIDFNRTVYLDNITSGADASRWFVKR